MAIKTREALSRADFDQAVVRLRANMSDIAKETGVPRTYLSEFRNGDRKLRPERLAKLRDYFESKGIEFEDNPEDDGADDDDHVASPHPLLAVGTVCFFPIRSDLPEQRVREVMAEIVRNDARIAELLAIKEMRGYVFIGQGDLSDETQDSIRELFAVCAANYMLVRYLTGTDNPLAQPAEQNTLNAILLDTVSDSIKRAGIEVPAALAEEHEEADA